MAGTLGFTGFGIAANLGLISTLILEGRAMRRTARDREAMALIYLEWRRAKAMFQFD